MKAIRDFLTLFTEDDIPLNSLNPIEDLYAVKVSYTIDKYINPEISEFIKISTLICSVLENNTFEFSFKVINSKNPNYGVHPELVRTLDSSSSKNEEFIKETYEEISNNEFDKIENNEFIYLEINIKKPLELEKINRIYFFDEFIESFDSLNLKEIISNPIINNLTGDTIFLIDDEIPTFYTNDIYFIHGIDEISDLNVGKMDYDNIFRQHKLNCHFINSNLYATPYTFKLIKYSNSESINNFFKKLEIITSLIYITNYSEVTNSNSINFHINGYKLINENLNFTELKTTTSSFFDIFDWIYKENKVSEKLEMARNIISIDFRNSLNNIDDKTLASIKSNYNIYLKENVDRYIELKNQITNNILDLSMKSRDIIAEFSSNFKNAFMANLSFIFSMFILNLVGDASEFDNLFNKNLSILYLIIIGMSVCYLVLSIITTYFDLRHYNTTFENLKKLYIGILSDEDLTNTFDNSILNSDKKYIIKRISVYSISWFIILIISIFGLYYLSKWFEVEVINNIIPMHLQNSIKTYKPLQ